MNVYWIKFGDSYVTSRLVIAPDLQSAINLFRLAYPVDDVDSCRILEVMQVNANGKPAIMTRQVASTT